MKTSIAKLEEKLNYFFKNFDLLQTALTHKSYSKDNNEKLEFLGDAVLSVAISIQLYSKLTLNEGQMSHMRANMINKENLIKVAIELELNNYIIVGDSIKLKQGSMLADCLEAIFGAIMLDSDIDTAVSVIQNVIKHDENHKQDYKTKLQELLQQQKHHIPKYSIKEIKGLDHERIFSVECQCANVIAIGHGLSKKLAEQNSARAVLHLIYKLNLS